MTRRTRQNPSTSQADLGSLSSVYAGVNDVPVLVNKERTFSVNEIPQPILDLNYASTMSLYGIETHTRTVTTTYTDMAGNTQTAAIDAPAFDRTAVTANNWILPAGLKISDGSMATFNPVNLLPATYTVVIDVNRLTSFTDFGIFFQITDGTTSNRLQLGISSTYQAFFLVQANGSVVVNANMGNIQAWYGGPRRLVIAVKAGAFAWSDNGHTFSSISVGSAPLPNTRTQLILGANTFKGWINRIQILPEALTLPQVIKVAAGLTPIACWGDSLTEGTGGTSAGRYPERMRSHRTPGSGVYNGGVGGETSTQIRVRALADTQRKGWTSVFWTGRNNIDQANGLATVMADTDAMVTNIGHSRFLVMSVINASSAEGPGTLRYATINAMNAALAAKYPDNYLDIRSLLVAASGGSNDSPNVTWTFDGLHLNDTGYAYVASQASQFLRVKGWY